ncbi:MAG: flagellar motor protein MotB [Bryobacteraceae bacterium]
MSDSQTPVYVIRKKGRHGGHHGGAWKVAYADFVTAMMALFIVLWLLTSSEEVKKAVGGYFQDPTGGGKLMGSTLAGVGEGLIVHQDDMNQLKEAIEKAMKEVPKIEEIKEQVKITVTGEGLRIELMEKESGTFFKSGSAGPSQSGSEMLKMLAEQLSKLPNKLLIEGHTDSKPFSSERDYGNWELSADRGNAARRLMENSGIRRDQVAQVRGFADQSLLMPDDPSNPSNRRISVIVKYRDDEKKNHANKASKELGKGGHGKPAEGHGGQGAGGRDAPSSEPAKPPESGSGKGGANRAEDSSGKDAKSAGAAPAGVAPVNAAAPSPAQGGKVSGKTPAKTRQPLRPPDPGNARPAGTTGAPRARKGKLDKELASVRAPSDR